MEKRLLSDVNSTTGADSQIVIRLISKTQITHVTGNIYPEDYLCFKT